MKKTPLKILLSTLAIALLVLIAGSFYMLDYALGSQKLPYSTYYQQLYKQEPVIKGWIDSLKQTGGLRDTFVTLSNGERSHALYARHDSARGKTAILVHGYKDAAVKMLPYARLYYEMGMNIILPDLHGHGLSDGEEIQMGWKDRLTIEEWMRIAHHAFSGAADSTRLYLHGISMGAATVMCVAGDNPEGLVAVVEDSGYTNAWDEFKKELRERFSLPAFPLMHVTSWLCELRYGWNFRQASPLRQVSKARCPMLFIHGDADKFVPTEMVYPLYEAKKGGKQLWVTKGSEHVMSLHDYHRAYREKLALFVKGAESVNVHNVKR